MPTTKVETIEAPTPADPPPTPVASAAPPRRGTPGLAIAGIIVGGVLVAGALFGGGVFLGSQLPDRGGPGQHPGIHRGFDQNRMPGGPNGFGGVGPNRPGPNQPDPNGQERPNN